MKKKMLLIILASLAFVLFLSTCKGNKGNGEPDDQAKWGTAVFGEDAWNP